MGFLKELKKKAIKEAKGAVGLKKNEKVSTQAKKGIVKGIKNFIKG